MRDFLKIFKGKKVLVTGDTGFKGSWLSYWLCILEAEVHGFALPPEHVHDHFNELELGAKIHHSDGDIRDFSQILGCMKKTRPDFVFHLAAQPLVRESYNEPKKTFDTNITGTVNLLESVRLTPSVKSLVVITSDKCYKNKEWHWGYRENDELGGKDPYSASKAAAEIVFSAYNDSFYNNRAQFAAATVRAGNVIGGGDWSADRIVPDCIRALQNSKPIQIRNPKATRPWQHVLEPLSGYLLLASQLYKNPKQFRGSYNFGPDSGEMHTVEDLAKEIVKIWGKGEIAITKKSDSLPEAGLLHLNCDKAHHYLGWHSKWNFKKTVGETVKWYKSVKNGQSAKMITKQQIIEYMES